MEERVGEVEEVPAQRVELAIRQPVQHRRDPHDRETDDERGRWPAGAVVGHRPVGMSRMAGAVSAQRFEDRRAARPTTSVATIVIQNTTG